MKLSPLLLSLALGTATITQSFAEEEERRPVVTVDLQCVTLPLAQALPLITKLRSSKPEDPVTAVAEIAALLEKGTAKLLAWPSVTTRAGQVAKSEQIEEIRYPTQFSSGSASIYLTNNEGTVTQQPSRVRGADLPPVANSFDTRNVGITLEVEPTVASGQIEIPFKATHTLLKSIDRWAIEHEFTTEKKTEKVIQEQPRFTVYSAQNLALLKSGDRKLVGVFKTDAPEPALELFVLGAEILERK